MDRLENGLSAIYTYFEPAEEKRSLGSYVILWQIGRARELGLPAVYLGYWIRNCRKMNYKTRLSPPRAVRQRPLGARRLNRWAPRRGLGQKYAALRSRPVAALLPPP